MIPILFLGPVPLPQRLPADVSATVFAEVTHRESVTGACVDALAEAAPPPGGRAGATRPG